LGPCAKCFGGPRTKLPKKYKPLKAICTYGYPMQDFWVINGELTDSNNKITIE